jgi:hypothetical protein
MRCLLIKQTPLNKQCGYILLLGLLGLVSPAWGADAHLQELEDILARGQQYYSQQEAEKTLELLDQAAQLIWSRLPLSIHQTHLLQTPPGFNGQYQLRQDARLKPREPLVIYFQPQGFMVRRQDDMFLYHLAVDYKLSDAWGRVLQQNKDSSEFKGSEFSFPSHLALVITYDFSGLSYGAYQLEAGLRDLYSQQSTSWQILFSIEP